MTLPILRTSYGVFLFQEGLTMKENDIRLNEALKIFMASKYGVVSRSYIVFMERRFKKLLDYFGDIPANDIHIHDLRAWRASLFDLDMKYKDHPCRDPIPGNLSPWTIHQHIRTVKMFFRWLYLEGYISHNPGKRLENVQLPSWEARGINKADRDKMLKAAKEQRDIFAAARNYAILLFIADTGCRRSGVALLRIDDLYLDDNKAFIREKGRGGLHKSRMVFFKDKTKQALIKWLKYRGKTDCDFVFTSLLNHSYGIKPEVINNICKKTAKLAGVKKKYHPHQWRHGTIRAWLEAGMPLPTASQLAGHTTVKITGDIYGIVTESKLRSEHNKYSWV